MSTFWWAVLASYLWITGGLGWAYQHECDKGLQLTPTGKAIIVALFPFFAFMAIAGEAVAKLRALFIYYGPK